MNHHHAQHVRLMHHGHRHHQAVDLGERGLQRLLGGTHLAPLHDRPCGLDVMQTITSTAVTGKGVSACVITWFDQTYPGTLKLTFAANHFTHVIEHLLFISGRHNGLAALAKQGHEPGDFGALPLG